MAELRVRVARRWQAAADVAAFSLVATAGSLPMASAGAHVEVHVPGGHFRHYSLINAPGEIDAYIIGVKLELNSRGGSRAVHELLKEGDEITISTPRNNFALVPADHSLLLAGGIGVTPLVAMARQLHASAASFALHYFARSAEHIAFRDILDRLGDRVSYHPGLDGAATGAELERLLRDPKPRNHAYICGPGPMMDAALTTAKRLGWPSSSLHVEYFTVEIDKLLPNRPFQVRLARGNRTFEVPANKSMLEAIRDNGVDLESSCEQGICGTCFTKVLEGTPDHRDVFLTDEERAGGTCVMPCISRAKSDLLVLDL
ncbi:MAG: PDR/VanB family oxidoreductase [Dongiaceae bacterium]